MRRLASSFGPAVVMILCCAASARAVPFLFSTGDPNGVMATASRPTSAGKFEIESADDFVLTDTSTTINHITFTGLITGGATTANVGLVDVEVYRVFPKDSNVGRTSGPPTFSTPLVPTRVNSPSDVALVTRDTGAGDFTFTTTDLGPFSANNSVQAGGIHPKPNQTTLGNGPVTGEEVRFNLTLSNPLNLPADHYFFIPQVEITTLAGDFLWLSAPKPIVSPGTPFPPGFTDLQSWTRDVTLDPDWLRIGTDIVGGTSPPTFNAAFSLSGEASGIPAGVPEPLTGTLASMSVLGLCLTLTRRRSRT